MNRLQLTFLSRQDEQTLTLDDSVLASLNLVSGKLPLNYLEPSQQINVGQ